MSLSSCFLFLHMFVSPITTSLNFEMSSSLQNNELDFLSERFLNLNLNFINVYVRFKCWSLSKNAVLTRSWLSAPFFCFALISHKSEKIQFFIQVFHSSHIPSFRLLIVQKFSCHSMVIARDTL